MNGFYFARNGDCIVVRDGTRPFSLEELAKAPGGPYETARLVPFDKDTQAIITENYLAGDKMRTVIYQDHALLLEAYAFFVFGWNTMAENTICASPTVPAHWKEKITIEKLRQMIQSGSNTYAIALLRSAFDYCGLSISASEHKLESTEYLQLYLAVFQSGFAACAKEDDQL